MFFRPAARPRGIPPTSVSSTSRWATRPPRPQPAVASLVDGFYKQPRIAAAGPTASEKAVPLSNARVHRATAVTSAVVPRWRRSDSGRRETRFHDTGTEGKAEKPRRRRQSARRHRKEPRRAASLCVALGTRPLPRSPHVTWRGVFLLLGC